MQKFVIRIKIIKQVEKHKGIEIIIKRVNALNIYCIRMLQCTTTN